MTTGKCGLLNTLVMKFSSSHILLLIHVSALQDQICLLGDSQREESVLGRVSWVVTGLFHFSNEILELICLHKSLGIPVKHFIDEVEQVCEEKDAPAVNM